MRFILLCFFLFLLTACGGTTHQGNPIKIHLSKDEQAVYISGLDYAVIQQLKADSLTRDSWQHILQVYRLPVDIEMKDFQNIQPGNYQLNDSVIIFKPDTAFKKSQHYFARFYANGPINTLNIIQGTADLKRPAYIEARF